LFTTIFTTGGRCTAIFTTGERCTAIFTIWMAAALPDVLLPATKIN
jgi:hypothetical protein